MREHVAVCLLITVVSHALLHRIGSLGPTERAQAGGSHLLLDYDNFMVNAEEAGPWLLGAMSEEAQTAGVREVHRKLVLLGVGKHKESLPGFTSVVLIDESHITAHCYSEQGWLALDVFTCGRHDPTSLAERLHERITDYAPQARCLQYSRADRFMHRVAESRGVLQLSRGSDGVTKASNCDTAYETHVQATSTRT